MLKVLLDGLLTLERIAELAKQKARKEIHASIPSITGHRLSEHQRFLFRQ